MLTVHVARDNKEEILKLSLGATALDAAKKLSITSPSESLFCLINKKASDLATSLQENDHIEFISFSDPRGKEVFWHTSAHVLAQAVLRLFPNAKPTIGPAIDEGFYYDFADLTISDEDFSKIEEEALRIIESNLQPKKHSLSKEEALFKFPNNPYKAELIEGIASLGEALTGYSQGEFFDLCRGPHLAFLGKIKAFKILKTSGAYWRGDAKKEMLTRIYGISFPTKQELKDYLHMVEEAKKRDHKILGPRLNLFMLREEAPGIPFILPKGMIVWNRLLDFWREKHRQYNYTEIKTPSMMTKSLWEVSGHWQNYRANMFTSVIEEREFAIKPMNCPGGMLYYKSTGHSYREFPLRVGEIGHVHRYEASGALSGLFRVRSFHQDDAHIFMQREQIQDVMKETLALADELYSVFGLSYTLVLSTKPEANTIGSDEDWEIATKALKQALETTGRKFTIAEGDGAFYGPKIDFRIHDALGRAWQCGTIQLDMALPERFQLEYTAQDGSKKRPVMIHRALLGSIERFFGSLIEYFAGKFPLWISPSQIAIVPVADRHVPYANTIRDKFFNMGFEVLVDDSNESVSKKIREAQINLYNYILTVGDKEVEAKNISVRTRDNVVHGEMDVEVFAATILKEREEKMLASPLTAPKTADVH